MESFEKLIIYKLELCDFRPHGIEMQEHELVKQADYAFLYLHKGPFRPSLSSARIWKAILNMHSSDAMTINAVDVDYKP